jgi:antitoxin PrlF
MGTATLTSKGQTTIPLDIRTGLGLQAGDQIEFHLRSDGSATLRAKRGSLQDFIGVLAKQGTQAATKAATKKAPKKQRALTVKEMDAGIAKEMRLKHGDRRK